MGGRGSGQGNAAHGAASRGSGLLTSSSSSSSKALGFAAMAGGMKDGTYLPPGLPLFEWGDAALGAPARVSKGTGQACSKGTWCGEAGW